MTVYDIAVIGKGLIGSAAACHLAASFPDLKICVIGPDEPKIRKAHDGVFASHYDQGTHHTCAGSQPVVGASSARVYQTVSRSLKTRAAYSFIIESAACEPPIFPIASSR